MAEMGVEWKMRVEINFKSLMIKRRESGGSAALD